MRGVRMRTLDFSMKAMRRQVLYSREKPSGLFLRSLFLILVLALSFVPVFQAAHALTHVDSIHEALASDEPAPSEGGSDVDSDIDRVCTDCLALTAFSIIFSTLAIFFRNHTGQRNRLQDGPACVLPGSAPLYSTRAPPWG
jgi:hypothetical protein